MKKLVLLLAVMFGASMVSCGGGGEKPAGEAPDSVMQMPANPDSAAEFIDSTSSEAQAILDNAAADVAADTVANGEE